jgi:4'-phosphopantetheinyl transferase
VQLLSSDERERAARFRLEEHRERSQICRGLLRTLLARYTGSAARDLSFAYNAHGKPEIRNAGVHFNTSHSGDFAAFAFARAGAVGVDIEQIRNDPARHEQIGQRYFAPGERQQLQIVEATERSQAFFDLWTRKEAFVKARGDGLFSGLDQFEILLEPSRVLSVGGVPAINWWMAALPEIIGYAGAVVVNTQSCSPRFWKYDPV